MKDRLKRVIKRRGKERLQKATCVLHPRQISKFILVSGLSVSSSRVKVKMMACSNHHSVCVDFSNRLFTWGRNHMGQLGNGSLQPRTKPTLLKFYSEELPILNKYSLSTREFKPLSGLLLNVTKVLCDDISSAVTFSSSASASSTLIWGKGCYPEHQLNNEGYSFKRFRALREEDGEDFGMIPGFCRDNSATSDSTLRLSRISLLQEQPWRWPMLSVGLNPQEESDVSSALKLCQSSCDKALFLKRDDDPVKHLQRELLEYFVGINSNYAVENPEVDLRIDCKDGSLYCNASLLAVRWPYVRLLLFREGWTGSRKDSVELNSIFFPNILGPITHYYIILTIKL